MSAALRRRVEALELAHQCAKEAALMLSLRVIPEIDFATRLAALLSIGDAVLMRITARARSVVELVGYDAPPPAQIAVSDASEQMALARKAETEIVTARLHAEAAAEAAARFAAEASRAAQPPARAARPDWFTQFQ